MDYWEMRAARRLEQNEEGAKESLRVLGKAFARAQKDILADMERLERSMGNKYGLTPMEVRALLDKPCGREEYLRLLERIEQLPRGDERNALMAQAAAPSYAFRRSRLEALRDQTRARTALLASEYEQQVTGQLDKTIREAYARAGFDAQARIGFAAPFAAMNEGAVRRILQAPWSGMHFSKRIWQNQEALTELLNETITGGFMTGRSTKSMIAEVQEKMGVAYRAAERLVRTETAAMASMADKEAYKSARIKKYRYLATLDSLTSKICMTLDGEVFDVDKMVIGRNCPPMHPHCRSTTTAEVEGVDLSKAQRRSKDPATGMPVRVPRTMSYKEWEKLQQDIYERNVTENGRPEDDTSDLLKINKELINSEIYRQKFLGITGNNKVDEKILQCAREMLRHRSGTIKEDLYLIDMDTGETILKQFSSNSPSSVHYTQDMIDSISKAHREKRRILAIHTHPTEVPPSAYDFRSMRNNGYSLGVVCTHTGVVYTYTKSTHKLTIEDCEYLHDKIDILRNEKYTVERAYATALGTSGLHFERR